MKTLFFGDFNCGTGFSRVSEKIIYSLVNKLPKSFIFDVLGINYYGQRKVINDRITLFSAFNEGDDKNDIYGRTAILKFIKSGNYDTVFLYNDISVIYPMLSILKLMKDEKQRMGNPIKLIIYFPIDSSPHLWHFVNPQTGENNSDVFDNIVTFSHYGKNELLKTYGEFNRGMADEMKERIKVIEHGTEKDGFPELDRKDIIKFRKDTFGIDDDIFLMGQVNRNSSRKDLPTSLILFKMFIDALSKNGEKTDKIKLYLHCNPFDVMGYNLYEIAHALKIKPGNIIFPAVNANEIALVDQNTLNMIMRSFDLFYTNTTAEGWGLTPFEAMECSVPVILPHHTSLSDIPKDFIFSFDSFQKSFFINDGSYERFKTELELGSLILYEVYDMVIKKDSLVSDKVKAAKRYADKFDWNEITDKWTDLFLSLNTRIIIPKMRILKN